VHGVPFSTWHHPCRPPKIPRDINPTKIHINAIKGAIRGATSCTLLLLLLLMLLMLLPPLLLQVLYQIGPKCCA
jgi:hypothetical protein